MHTLEEAEVEWKLSYTEQIITVQGLFCNIIIAHINIAIKISCSNSIKPFGQTSRLQPKKKTKSDITLESGPQPHC